MKKRLLLLMMACFMVSAIVALNPKSANADVMGSVSGSTLTISGTGAMANFTQSSTAPWYSSRASITKIVINSGVTSIGDYAFKDLTKVTSVSIPSTVTTIGKEAFWNCSALTSLSIPDSVTTIKSYAFEATGLTSVYLSDYVVNMDMGAFYNCKSLKSCTFTYAITTIPDFTFYGCSALEKFYIPLKITSIGQQAFSGCTALKQVTIKRNCTQIKSNAFKNCTALKNIYFPCNPPTIASDAFTGVTATATYIRESDNANWTSAKRVQAGGTINWQADYMYFGSSPTLSTTAYTYDGTAKKPALNMVSGDYTHASGVDYTMTYTNNVKAGSATATVKTTGIWGSYSFTRSFTINKANTTMSVSPASPGGYPGRTSQLTCTPAKTDATYTYTYASSDTNVATVSSTGLITFKNAGTATITITCKSDNYNDIVQKVTATTYKPTTISASDVTLSYTSTVYDGTAKKPAVTVKVGSTNYSSDYYTTTYSNNTNAGTATVTVTGRYMLAGTVSKTFTIDKASQPTIYWNSSPIPTKLAPGMTADYSVTGFMGTIAYSSSDTSIFTVSNSGTVTAKAKGSATLNFKVTGTSNYKDTTLTATINVVDKTNISTLAQSCTMSATSFIYDGTAKKPTITLSVSGTRLYENTDYTLSYTNNTNAGTATMTITGINLYSGTATRSFTINRADQTLNAYLSSNSLTIGKTCTIYAPGLKTSATYTSSNTSVATISGTTVTAKGNGTTTIKVTAASNTNYNSATAEMTLTVAQTFTSISSGTLTLGTSSYTYDGSAKEPATTLVVSGKTLTKGTDYVVAYTNNVNAGTATVTVNGAGSYNGTLTKTFTISKASQTLNASASKTTLVPGETASITATATTAISYSSSNTGVATVNPTGTITAVAVGTANINVTAASNTNYNAASKTIAITVKKDVVDLSTCTITLGQENFVYNGNARKPAVTVKEGSATLTADTDYTVSYSNNTNAGTASVTITGKGNYTGTVTKTFTITKKNQTLSVSCTADTLGIGDTAEITATGVGAVTFTSNDPSVAKVVASSANKGTVTALAGGIASITVSCAGDDNTYAASEIVSINVKKVVKQISSCTIKLGQTSFTYNGTERLPSITVMDGSEVLTQGMDYTVVYENQIDAGTATAIIAGKGDYEGVVKKNYTIKPVKATVSYGSESTTNTFGNNAFSVPAKSNYPDEVQYSSSNTKVVTVDKNGRVTIVGMGCSTITAEIVDTANRIGATASFAVYIKPKQTKGLKAANANTGVQLNWTALAKVSGYQVYRKKGTGSFTKIATVTTNKYLDKTAENGINYTYKVRAQFKASDPTGQTPSKTLYGAYSATAAATFVKRPAISSLTNVTKLSMNVKWAKNAKASGYQIQYSTSSSFSSPKTVTVSGAATVSKKITSLKKGKTYYVRLRTFKTVSGTKKFSTYSASKKIKISK